MVDWAALDFRKLYLPFSTSFERLPYAARAMGADIIRRCDREGRIVKVTEVTDVTSQLSLLVSELAFHFRAHPGEEQWIEMALKKLLGDRYLLVEDGWLKIRNFVEAQKSSSAERMARKRQRDSGKRPIARPVTSDASDVTPVTGDARGHSDESDQEEKRREENDPPNPLGGSDGVPPSGLMHDASEGYIAGVRAATEKPWGFPEVPAEWAALRTIVSIHAPGARSEILKTKLTIIATKYVRARKAYAQFEKGFCPSKCLEWLNTGAMAGPKGVDAQNDRARRAADQAFAATERPRE